MKKRTQAREDALQMLYLMHRTNCSASQAAMLVQGTKREGVRLDDFSKQLAEGVEVKQNEIDEKLEGASSNWRMDRMADVDRAVLRLATYELMFEHEIPKAVSINEAIELAKKFGDENSASFVNGVLDRIGRENQKE